MTTGVRRGEFCGVRLSSLDLADGCETIWLRRAIRRQPGASRVVAGLKTHQQRRIALDAETVLVLSEHIKRCHVRAAQLRITLPADAVLFSLVPDWSSCLTPHSVTQRYERMVNRLGTDTTIRKLRHYSATELIAAGVDPRSAAGRLGHGGGGTTTLKTYSAWVSEADQCVAKGIGAHVPISPVVRVEAAMRRTDPWHPYEIVAAAVHRRTGGGELEWHGAVPSAVDLAAEHNVLLTSGDTGACSLDSRRSLIPQAPLTLTSHLPTPLSAAAGTNAIWRVRDGCLHPDLSEPLLTFVGSRSRPRDFREWPKVIY